MTPETASSGKTSPLATSSDLTIVNDEEPGLLDDRVSPAHDHRTGETRGGRSRRILCGFRSRLRGRGDSLEGGAGGGCGGCLGGFVGHAGLEAGLVPEWFFGEEEDDDQGRGGEATESDRAQDLARDLLGLGTRQVDVRAHQLDRRRAGRRQVAEQARR